MGCIPVVISDHWVLPFSNTIPWADYVIRVHEHYDFSDLKGFIDEVLLQSHFTRQFMCKWHLSLLHLWNSHFSTPSTIVDALMRELDVVLKH